MKASGVLWRLAYLLAASGILIVDQMSKAWAARFLRLRADRIVIPGLLNFSYAENRGIAFGQLQEGGPFGRWLLVVLAGLAALFVLLYFFRTPREDDRVLGACALLLAGITGNLLDRIRLGFVIDFIDVHVGRIIGRRSTSPMRAFASELFCSLSICSGKSASQRAKKRAARDGIVGRARSKRERLLSGEMILSETGRDRIQILSRILSGENEPLLPST